MKKVYKISFLFTILLAALTAGPVSLFAKEKPELQMAVSSPNVYLGEPFILKIQLRNADPSMSLDVDYLKEAFELEFLRMEPMAHSVTITINGKTTHSEEKGGTFLYRLTPKKGGKIQIESPHLTIDSETITAPPITIEVIAPQKQDLARIEMSVEPETIYSAAPFDVILTLNVKELPGKYKTKDPVLLLSNQLAPPQLTIGWADDNLLPSGIRPAQNWQEWISGCHNPQGGFSINQITNPDPFNTFFGNRPEFLTFAKAPEKVTLQDDTGNTVTYWQYKFRRTFTADQTGNFNFGSVILKGSFVKEDENGTLNRSDIYTITEPLYVTVSDVPEEGRPADYIGAVGQFELHADLSPRSVKVGEAMTLSLTLSGTGSTLNAHSPDLASNENLKGKFKIYPPTEEAGENQIKWTWSLRPLTEGTDPFPPLQISTFDTHKNKYVTLQSETIPLAVEKGDGNIVSFDENDEETQTGLNQERSPLGIYANIEKAPRQKMLSFKEWSIIAGTLWGTALFFCGGIRLLRRKAETAKVQLAGRIRKGEEILKTAFAEERNPRQGVILRAFLTPAEPYFHKSLDAVTSTELDPFLDRLASSFSEGTDGQDTINEFRKFMKELEEFQYSGSSKTISEEKVTALYFRWVKLFKGNLTHSRKTKTGKRSEISKSFLTLFLLTLFLSSAAGCRTDTHQTDQFNEAVRLFSETDLADGTDAEKAVRFQKIAALYEGILKEGEETGEVLYNQGNAYFRAGDKAHALASWRKAEKYMPREQNLKANILLLKPGAYSAKSSILNHLFFWQKILSWQTKGNLLVLFSLLGTLLLITAEFIGNRVIRRQMRLGAAVGFIAVLLFFSSLYADRLYYDQSDHAVIAAEDTFARKGGSRSYEPVFKDPVPPLTETRILETRNGWFKVRFAEGETGWIESDQAVRW